MNVVTDIENIPLSPRRLLKDLRRQYAVFRDCQPLSIGIDKQIFLEHPNIDRKVLRIALSIHTNSTLYLKGMERATVRYNLKGETAGEVVAEHRERAKSMLQERYKKIAEQKKTEREAEQAERRRTEKLELLTQKFARAKR